MDYRRRMALAGEGRLELQEAARIAGGYCVGVERGDELGFAVAEGVCRVWLDKIIDAGGAAADGAFRDFCYLEAGNFGKQFTRLSADALGVLQVAGVVERDAKAQRISCGAWRKLGENFGDVLAFGGEGFGTFGILWIVAEQMAVFLDIRAAACGVGDDCFHIGALKCVDGFSRERQSAVFFSCMNHQRAAARLIFRRDNFAAFGG